MRLARGACILLILGNFIRNVDMPFSAQAPLQERGIVHMLGDRVLANKVL